MKFKVSNGMTKIIKANSSEEAEEIFLDSFNECMCGEVSVVKMKGVFKKWNVNVVEMKFKQCID